MINKRFSLYDAYNFGLKTVLNHFGFFLATMFVGGVLSFLLLVFLGAIDFWLFQDHFTALIDMFTNALNNPAGALHTAGMTVHDQLNVVLPQSITKHIAPGDTVAIDISGQEITNILLNLAPVGIVFKFLVDVISVGWTKIALDLQANKTVSLEYIYKFYYLVPRVFIVSLIVGIVTLIGLMLFVVPGVFVYQRLRFARYFIIDKNQSIMQSLESSWKMTDGTVLHLTGYSFLAGLIAGLGSVVTILHVFLAPLSFQVDASVYRQMVK